MNQIFFDSLQKLIDKFKIFPIEIKEINKSLAQCTNSIESELRILTNCMVRIEEAVQDAKNVKSITLLDQDYVNFCFLLIDGNDLAEYLLTQKATPEKICKQARSLKDNVIKFKPFLKNCFNKQ